MVEIVEPTRLTIGESTLGIAKSPAAVTGAELVVTLDGPIADLTALAPGLMPDGITAEGTVKAEVFLGARLDTFQPTGQATLELATPPRGEQELASGVKVVADADTRTIRVSDFAGTVLGSPVAGRGHHSDAVAARGHRARQQCLRRTGHLLTAIDRGRGPDAGGVDGPAAVGPHAAP